MRKRDRTPTNYTRLTHPLVRDSRDEPFRSATWEEALERAAAGLARNRGAFGMFSCARATNEMNYVAQLNMPKAPRLRRRPAAARPRASSQVACRNGSSRESRTSGWVSRV